MKSILLFIVTSVALIFYPNIHFGQAPNLGTAANFVLFTTVGAVTNTGISQVTGNVGTNSGSSTGFGNVNGVMNDNNGVTAQCASDLLIAYNALNTTVPDFFPAPLLGNGQILNAGVYSISGPTTLNLNLTLDALGDPNAVFIFQIQGALSTGAGAKVLLVNGAKACNVFWKVEGLVSMAPGTFMKGTVIANNAGINMSTGCKLEGRALSTTGALTLDGTLASTPIGCGSANLTGPIAPDLSSAACYTIFSSNGPVTNSGITYVTGDVGTNSGLTTGYNPLFVTGSIHPIPDGSTAAAAADLLNAYTYINALPNDIELLYPTQFGNSLVLTPHTYVMNAACTFTDTLFLNAMNNVDAVFVIKIYGALTTSVYAKVKLINGTQAKNVYWLVNGAVSLNTYSEFVGTIVCNNGAMNLLTGVTLDGLALTTTGALNTYAINATRPMGLGASVISPPADQVVCVGDAATFIVVGSGTSYQWRKGTTNLIDGGNISGANSATLTIDPVTLSDAATNYNVVVTGACSSVQTSPDIRLTVNPLTGNTSFSNGLTTLCQDAPNETYTATATNSTSIEYSVLPLSAGVININTGIMNWDAAFSGQATITATSNGLCGITTADLIVTINPITGTTIFVLGSISICQDAMDETYEATSLNSTSITYSVLPSTAGVINANTGVMNWDAAFTGQATITATSIGLCGTTDASIIVTVSPYVGVTSFTNGATSVCQNPMDETYTAIAANSTSIVYSVLPLTAGVINANTGVMNWDAAFTGQATITATSTGICGTTTADLIVTVSSTPIIITQPADQIVCDGNSASFSVTAVGPGNTYQWRKGTVNLVDGGNISGATTSTLTINPASSADIASDYNVVVTGPCSSIIVSPVVNLNTAGEFGILSATGISSTGFSEIHDMNVGISPGARSSITGFPPAIVVNGFIYASDDIAPPGVAAMLIQAKQDLTDAYLFAEGATIPAPATVSGDQGGLTLAPGIYKSTSTLLIQSGDLTLDAQGDPDAYWIFQIASDFTTVGGAGGSVILSGGAQAKNVYWQVGSSATIGNGTSFKGIIMALTSITMNTGSSIEGKLLARNGAIVLSGTNIINNPSPFISTEDPFVVSNNASLDINPSTGTTSFTAGATSVCQDAMDETYTAIAANSTSIIYSVLPLTAGVINANTGVMNWDAAFSGQATITASSIGLCGNTSASVIVTVSPIVGATSFTNGATSVCQDAMDETYIAIAANSTSITYSVLPLTAGVINANTGVMNWDAAFSGQATITASSTGLCGNTSASVIVTVNPLIGTTSFTAGAITICQDAVDETYTALAANSTSVVYSVLPISAGVINANTGIMNWDAAFSGQATITATSTGLCGTTNASVIVTVSPLVGVTSFTVGATTICQDAVDETYTALAANSTSVVYSVLPISAGIIDANTGIMNWDAAFSGQATITATSTGLCGNTNASIIVTVNPSVGTTSFTAGVTSVCQDAVDETYTAIAANSTLIMYSVLPVNAGVINSSTGVMNWDAAFSGQATITASSIGLCGNTSASIIVTVNPSIGITSFTAGSSAICQDATDETYSAIAANSSSVVYSVLPVNAGVINSSTGVMNWDSAFIGQVTITATSTGLCGTSNASVIVTVSSIPIAVASSNAPICAGSTLILNAQTVQDATYQWTNPNEFSSTDQNPEILLTTPSDSGTYTLVVTANGCASLPSSVVVIINSCDYIEFFIPEGFSPNSDGINDLFVIRGIDMFPNNTFMIYNRWGNKVFEASPYQNTWDGTNTVGSSIDGDKLPVGTYFYTLDLNNDTDVYKGTIYLNR